MQVWNDYSHEVWIAQGSARGGGKSNIHETRSERKPKVTGWRRKSDDCLEEGLLFVGMRL